LHLLPQNIDGVNYLHVKVNGLLFVATTRANVSPALILELLQRIARIIKDYCGILSEDSMRKNFVLVYELLDEIIVSASLSPTEVATKLCDCRMFQLSGNRNHPDDRAHSKVHC
jgi:hypothetical protein